MLFFFICQPGSTSLSSPAGPTVLSMARPQYWAGAAGAQERGCVQQASCAAPASCWAGARVCVLLGPNGLHPVVLARES